MRTQQQGIIVLAYTLHALTSYLSAQAEPSLMEKAAGAIATDFTHIAHNYSSIVIAYEETQKDKAFDRSNPTRLQHILITQWSELYDYFDNGKAAKEVKKLKETLDKNTEPAQLGRMMATFIEGNFAQEHLGILLGILQCTGALKQETAIYWLYSLSQTPFPSETDVSDSKKVKAVIQGCSQTIAFYALALSADTNPLSLPGTLLTQAKTEYVPYIVREYIALYRALYINYERDKEKAPDKEEFRRYASLKRKAFKIFRKQLKHFDIKRAEIHKLIKRDTTKNTEALREPAMQLPSVVAALTGGTSGVAGAGAGAGSAAGGYPEAADTKPLLPVSSTAIFHTDTTREALKKHGFLPYLMYAQRKGELGQPALSEDEYDKVQP